MSLAVAIQMDPVESINIETDSSFVLGLEAQRRGHALFHYLPRDLSFRQGRVIARARELQFKREQGNHAKLGEPQMLDLATLDIVLMRQDPPFDMAYVTATHLLEQVHPTMPNPVHSQTRHRASAGNRRFQRPHPRSVSRRADRSFPF